jgi:hypothetical protein
MLRDEVAEGQAEAETELRERFGLVPHGRPELTAVGGGLEPVAARPVPPPELGRHRRTDERGDD